jgi:hypothetical protein
MGIVLALSACSGAGTDSESQGHKERSPGSMDGFNQVSALASDYILDFAQLPLSGRAARTPWTDSYWPQYKGGIAYRWQTDESHTFASPARDEAMAMDSEDVARLSPAEKYDLLVGNYDYPLTARALASGTPNTPAWQGFCHGWTPASIHYTEPQPVVLTNPDGIRIAFGSSDVKALLTYFQGDVVATKQPVTELSFARQVRSVGTICGSEKPNDPGCYDVNPGAFHLVLSNQLGRKKEAFGIDATNTREKWNQPVHHFQSRILTRRQPSKGANPKASEEVIVRSTVTYTMEIEPTWSATTQTPAHSDHTVDYLYSVELDAAGTVIGGQWMHEAQHGHFMTFHEVYAYLLSADENNDGRPDYGEEQAKTILWQLFSFPDVVWMQDSADFSAEFEQAPSGYSLLATNGSTRKLMYRYFAKLGPLHQASIATP